MTGFQGVTGGSFGPAETNDDKLEVATAPTEAAAASAGDADDATAGGEFLLQPLGTVPLTTAGTCGPDSCEI